MLKIMNRRLITPQDLIEDLHPFTDGAGALARTRAEVRALRDSFEALLKTLTPAQLIAVYQAQHGGLAQYDSPEGWIELTAEVSNG